MRSPCIWAKRPAAACRIGNFDGDYLIIDRALDPNSSDVIVARTGPDYTIKNYSVNADVKSPQADNPDVTSIKLAKTSKSRFSAL